MKTLHVGLRVEDRDRSLAFYTALGYEVVGTVPLRATLAQLVARAIQADAPTSPDGSEDFLTTWLTDPDGYRLELVQWPSGHADGLTSAHFADHQQQP